MMSRLFPILWLVAFAAALMPVAVYEAHFVLAACAILAAGVSFALLKHPFSQYAAPVDVAFLTPVFAFWGLAFVSVLLSDVAYTSFLYFCFFSVFPLSLCCTLLVRDKARFFHVAGAGIAAIFAALAVTALVQFFAFPDMLVYGRAHWPFADPNSLAGLLVPGFFCAFGVMIAAKNRLTSNLGLVLAILIAGVLLVAGSRGAIFALAGGVAVFAALAFAHFRKHVRCIGILVFAAAIMVALTQAGGTVASESTGYRLGKTVAGNLPVLWERPEIWRSTWEIIKDHLWTGTGIGTFFLYYNEYRGVDYHSAGRMAHSDPLQFWAEMGVFAPVLFYIFIAFAVALTAKALRKVPRDDVRRVQIVAPFCALGALVLHTHITFHFHVISILMVMGIVTGYWFWQARQVAGESFAALPALRLPDRQMLKIALIVPLLAATYVFLMLQGGHILGAAGQARLYAGDLQGFVRDINRASALSQRKDAESMIFAVNVPLGLLETPGRKMVPEEASLYLAQGNKLLDETWALNPRLAAVPYFRARLIKAAEVHGVAPQGDKETLLNDALRLNPLYFPARLDLARLHLKRQESKKAYDVIADGLKWQDAAFVPPEYFQMLAALSLEHGSSDIREYALKMLVKIRRANMGNP